MSANAAAMAAVVKANFWGMRTHSSDIVDAGGGIVRLGYLGAGPFS